MGKSTGLTVAVVCGVAFGVLVLILVVCYKRWRLRKQSSSLKPFAPIKKRPRITHPAIPKPSYRADKLTVGDSGMKEAQDYVEEVQPDKEDHFDRSPMMVRRLKTHQSLPTFAHPPDAKESGGTGENFLKRTTPYPSLAAAGKSTSVLFGQGGGGTPPSRRGVGMYPRQSTSAYDPLDPLDDSESDAGLTSPLSLSSRMRAGSTCESPDEEGELGQVQFRLDPYKYEEGTFVFHLIQASNLPSKNFGGTSDPFAIVYLVNTSDVLPSGEVAVEKGESWRTKTQMKTLDPVFDERHTFTCPSISDLMLKAIYIQLFDYDRFSRNDLIGHVWLPLHGVDLSNIPTFWKALQPGKKIVSQSAPTKGRLQVSLAYSKSAHHITGFVLKAQQLAKMYNPYVNVDVRHLGQRVAKKRTPTQKHTDEPVFNDSFTFDIGPDRNIEDCGIFFVIKDRDRLHKNIIGCVSVGLEGQDSGQMHWADMIKLNGRQVIQWHDLQKGRRKSMGKSKSSTLLKK